MIACGASSCDGLTTTSKRKWEGFHGVPLVIVTSSRVRLNVQMGGDRGVDPGDGRAPTVTCLAVHAHIAPDEAMPPAVLLGRDGWADFPVRKYVDISASETVVTFTSRHSDAAETTKRYSDWVNNDVGFIDPSTGGYVVAHFSWTTCHIPNAMS